MQKPSTWCDTQDVFMLSKKYKSTSSFVTVKSKGGNIQKSKPDVVIEYTQILGCS